jgi:Protein of unknown function (DUF3102)
MLLEKKEAMGHGEWLPWLTENFEGSERHAQRYIKLYSERDKLLANPTRVSDLSLRGALEEIAAPRKDFPPEERTVAKEAVEQLSVIGPDLDRLAAMEENRRRGFTAEMAFKAMIFQGRRYSEALETIQQEDAHDITPELLRQLQAEADRLRWWVEKCEWIETLVRACDWPPGGGMPDAAFDEEKNHLPLSELYDPDGLPSPRESIREFCGPGV